ncbi:MAG: uroporphyrinogen-III synthase, partial [Planctomycetes bacterium]|nr:uroporphyrinogen-III synthase [Planctomycetota bacterium]
AIAAAAYAGIPVTHRGVAVSLAVVTGHEDPTKPESQVDWSKVAVGTGTLAIYMGMKNLRRNVGKIIAAGRDESTPVAVVSWGTSPRQRCVTGTLSTIADVVEREGIEAPAITIIGDVVGLRDRLQWFEKLPLFGKRIVTTRPRAQSAELKRRLERLGAEVLVFPTIRIVPVQDFSAMDGAIGRLGEYDWLIFTSINGVRIFFERMIELGRDARALAGCKLAAIGPATAQALRDRFLYVECVPRRYVAEEVVAALAALDEVRGKRFLLPRAGAARLVLPCELKRLGCHVDEVTVYETECESDVDALLLGRIAAGDVDVISFTSSSTVRNFAAIVGHERLKALDERVVFASIGPITSETARELGIRIDVEAEEHVTGGLVRALCDHFAEE